MQSDYAMRCEEHLVGGAMWAEPAHVAEVAGRVSPGDFLLRGCAQVWDAEVMLARAGKPLNFLTVSYVLAERGQLETVGGLDELHRLASDLMAQSAGALGALGAAAQVVREYAERRRGIRRLEREAQRVANGERESGTAIPGMRSEFE